MNKSPHGYSSCWVCCYRKIIKDEVMCCSPAWSKVTSYDHDVNYFSITAHFTVISCLLKTFYPFIVVFNVAEHPWNNSFPHFYDLLMHYYDLHTDYLTRCSLFQDIILLLWLNNSISLINLLDSVHNFDLISQNNGIMYWINES